MKRKSCVVMAAVCMAALLYGGCADENKGKADEAQTENDLTENNLKEEDGEQNNTNIQKQEENKGQIDTDMNNQEYDGENIMPENDAANAGNKQKNIVLDKELAGYRQERENSIKKANGLIEGGAVDERNYSLDLSGIAYTDCFDSRETTEAFKAARIYVTETLGITPNTKLPVYMCVDERILKIYEDDDKGVAAGYDNSNLYVCEYCNEDNVWQYVILVRDGKGSAWEVIHSGSSYKE